MVSYASTTSWADDINDEDHDVKKPSFDEVTDKRLDNGVFRHVTFSSGKTGLKDPSAAIRIAADLRSRQQNSRIVIRPTYLFSYICVSMASWEYALLANTKGLSNGGRAGLFWSYIWASAGWALISASLSEMASNGCYKSGQYHPFSNVVSPRRMRLFRHATGWLSFLSCQASTASGLFLSGRLRQSLVSLYVQDYIPQGWQSMLLVYPGIVIMVLFNIWGHRIIPVSQNIGLIIHMLGLIAIVVVLWALGPHVTAGKALLTFTNSSEWSSTGLALMIGQTTANLPYLGISSAIQFSPSLDNPARILPKALKTAFWTNATLGLLLICTLVFSLPDIQASLSDPFLYIFRLTLSSTAITSVAVVLIIFVTIHTLAYSSSVAQQIVQFAGTNGLPFSSWLAGPRVLSKGIDTAISPATRASILTTIIALLLSVLYLIPHAAAFDTVLSLATTTHLLYHILSISTHLYSKLRTTHHPGQTRWRLLLRKEVLINIAAVLYAVQAAFWALWPSNKAEVNYAGVIIAVVFVVASMRWWLWGCRNFGVDKEDGEDDTVVLIE